MILRDRHDAGRRLAPRCGVPARERPLVLALPRGGVPVAEPIALALRAPLDVLVVRKLGAPGQPELGLGAIAPDGVRVLHRGMLARLGLDEADLEEVERRERAELDRRERRYRAGRPPLDVAGRTVVLVDDGIATGGTVQAAVAWLRRVGGAGRIVLAVPVVAGPAARDLRREVDELVALTEPEDLTAIGAWYEDFSQTTDEEVVAALARADARDGGGEVRRAVRVPVPGATLPGDLTRPPHALGVVLFAHGSGSGRHSPRHRLVAEVLERAGLATLRMDLLTEAEARRDAVDGALRFDVRLLADRVLHGLDFLEADPGTADLPIGLFGASTGAAAALVAAAERPGSVRAVVSRGGRPDLAGARALSRVRAPTLFLVGEADLEVLACHRAALAAFHAPHRLHVVPAATHLFEEPGALEEVAREAAAWFRRHLPEDAGSGPGPGP